MKTIDILKNYYKNKELEILDGGKPYNSNTNTYEAVSLEYLYEYVLKKRITRKFIAKCLLKLCNQKFIRPIPCDYANGGDLVFIKYQNTYFYSIFRIENNKVHALAERTGKILEQINKFNSYLDEK